MQHEAAANAIGACNAFNARVRSDKSMKPGSLRAYNVEMNVMLSSESLISSCYLCSFEASLYVKLCERAKN
jgi:hypothetical protein